MKVADAARQAARRRISPLKARVLDYIQERPDEVYTYRDPDLIAALGIKPGALSFTLWSLERDGLIEKAEVNGQVFFGSPAAVAGLRQGPGVEPGDWLESVRTVRQQIWERTGKIDVIALLDEVRGPWD